MATKIATSRMAARYVVSSRLSTGGKVLGEEKKAADNKKIEKEGLGKLARTMTMLRQTSTMFKIMGKRIYRGYLKNQINSELNKMNALAQRIKK